MTHNNNINERLLDIQEWYRHVELEGKLWKKWINYWIEKTKNREVPVYFCRFEDIIDDPMKSLSEIFCFMLGQDSIKNTVIEQRIKEVLDTGSKGSLLYKPRVGGGVNKNIHNYTPDQLQYIKDQLEESIHFFGYAKHEGNPFGFFDYEGKAKEDNHRMFDEFKRLNEETTKW